MKPLLAAAAAILAALAGATAARAQDVPPVISPLRVEPDQNGVNLVSGKLTMDMPSLSVPGASHLTFDRVQNAAPYVNGSLTGGAAILGGGSTSVHGSYSVHTGQGTDAFQCDDDVCTSVTGTGSSFRINAYAFTQAGTGATWTFDLRQVRTTASNPNIVQYYASHVDYPNGERIDYTYDTYASGDSFGRVYYRPTRVSSNLGYFIAITYQGNTFGTNEWGTPASATLYASAAPTVPLESLTYSGNNITQTAGTSSRIFACAGCTNQLGADLEVAAGSLTLPGEGSAATIVTQHATAPLVASVVKDGAAWTYVYGNPRLFGDSWRYDSVTVDGPNSYHHVYTIGGLGFGPAERNVVAASTDPIGPTGRTTSYQYDQYYRPIKIVAPELNETGIGYDTYGNVIAGTATPKPGSGLSPVGQSAFYPTDDWNLCNGTMNSPRCYRPLWSRDGLGRQTDYVWNDRGQLTEQTDPADQNGLRKKTYISYETGALSRRSVVRMCLYGATCGTNQEIRTEYTYWGSTFLPSRERRIDAYFGRTRDTNYTYDSAGRLLMKDGPLPGTDDALYTRYDTFGRKTWEIGARSADGLRIATRFFYRNSDDKVTYSETGTLPDQDSSALSVFSRNDFTYDAHRNPIRESVTAQGATRQVTDKSFDDRGRLVCEARRMNLAALPAASSTAACALGTQGTAPDDYGPDRITHNVYDAASQLTQVQRAYATSLQQNYATYEYSNNGKQKAVIDANGNRAELTWDGFDRQRRWIFPSNTPGVANQSDYEEYGYDAVGNRTSLRKRDGSTLTYLYDNLNRVIRKTVPERSGLTAAQTRDVYYDYNHAMGLMTRARFDGLDGYGVTFYYDEFGQPTTTLLAMNGSARYVSYYHDDAGNLWRLTHPDGANIYSYYDALGRATSVLDNNSTSLDDYVIRYWYDGAGSRSAAVRGANAIGFGTNYYRDPLERPTVIANDLPGTANDSPIELAYNPASQIVSRTLSNNAYVWTGAYNVSRAYAVNGLNQYTAAGPASFTYDPNGNLTSDGTTSYTYDVENRLVSSSAGASLVYDPLGRLFQTSGGAAGTTQFLYDGDKMIAEYNGSGTLLRRYVHGPGADEPVAVYEGAALGLAGRRYTLPDHQGSIVGLINADGTPSAINTYDSWGIPGAANAGRFQYTGQAWIPELGMYYYKARIYSPTLGRFMQTDPIGYKDQINLYAYVGNDPMNGTDPTGTESCQRPPCTDIPRAPESVENAAVSALRQTSLSVGTPEAPIQVMVDKSDGTAVREVRTGINAGRPDPDNPMRVVMNRIAPTDKYRLGSDAHQHPRQFNPNEKNLAQRNAAISADRRNLYPSRGDYRHMNQTNAPMFNRNTAGAITETYRVGNVDHTVVIVPGGSPLGPVPSDVSNVVVDPN